MKTHIISILALLMLLFAACDTIDKDDYLVEVEVPDIEEPDPDSGEEPTFFKRSILIEDFTGQRCTNCPEAATIIENLKNYYGDDAITAVAIHCGEFGFAGNNMLKGLMTDEGKQYGIKWDVKGQPTGFINRAGGLIQHTDWATEVSKIDRRTSVSIKLESRFNRNEAGASSIDINVKVKSIDNLNAKLQLWIVEDGITAFQQDGDKRNMAYPHSHVFRHTVNGMDGDDIAVAAGATVEKHYPFVFDSSNLPADNIAYTPANCSIVAFVYNTNGVMQATSSKVAE